MIPKTTPWAIKRSQLIFVSNFVQNPQMRVGVMGFLQFLVFDLEMNGT